MSTKEKETPSEPLQFEIQPTGAMVEIEGKRILLLPHTGTGHRPELLYVVFTPGNSSQHQLPVLHS